MSVNMNDKLTFKKKKGKKMEKNLKAENKSLKKISSFLQQIYFLCKSNANAWKNNTPCSCLEVVR